MALDDLEGPRERAARPPDHHDTSVTYRGGGYFEGLVGTTPMRTGKATGTETTRDTLPASESTRSMKREEPEGARRRPRRSPTPSDSSEQSSESDSDEGPAHIPNPGGSPSPSDSDSSDSDYTSSDESRTAQSTRSGSRQANQELEEIVRKLKRQNERLEKKIVTQARSGYKAQTPKAYKGEANIDKYDMFIFNYKLYLSDTKLSDRKAVLTVSRFLEDKAATWYMMNVAPDPESYTMEAIYVGLYEYCFPPDFKEEVRRQYNQKRQGDSSVQDYFAELARLRRRLRDIDDRQHVLRAWEGAAQYIKVEWALKYMQPETTDIETLREAALAAERAHKIKRKIEKSGNDKYHTQRDRSRSPSRRSDRRSNYRSSANSQSGATRSNRSGGGNSNGNRPDKRQSDYKRNERDGVRDEAKDKREKLSNEERDRLKAAGLCYVCQRAGHLARDCPKFHKAKPSHMRVNAVKVKPEEKVRVSSVMLKELDELTRIQERIEVNAVRVKAKPTQGPKHIERNAVKVKDNTRKVPDTLVVEAKIEGKSVRALLDSGCQTDLISSTLVDQLRLQKAALTKPLQVQLAMAGSRGTLHYGVCARIEYQSVDEQREFDVGNLDNYDVILGTPFLFQHSVRLSFNPHSRSKNSGAAGDAQAGSGGRVQAGERYNPTTTDAGDKSPYTAHR
ncbi:hypothetical protein RSOLAG1IB_12547 [Rhizoctonia solani AG-1 IB]|uniref:CCHC-type domain-containing protein n=1 Tax=Thanatephorus cucumeris (strain AG1-IB / isolate 7/3/14) TaxID=1108050 RepID=A0A0B7G1I5_THACB|nr:hypothetical protein RSOLAG1IB_12547 [Rhizoctonia solani AG-1 IB]